MNNHRIFPTGIAACLLAVVIAPALPAQPTCSIYIGADQVICQGSSATLQGPSGFGNFLWSNGTSTQNTTVNATGDYWCQVSYPSGNLVTNGDFSSGNTGFTSQFNYSFFTVQNEGMYTVGPDASWYHNQFQGTGSGNFLIANAGYGSWVNGQLDVWCQTIPCCPGQTYTLGFNARTLSNALPARAVWMMDGNLVNWPDFTFPAYSAGWQQFTTTWTAGPGQTSVNACIRLTSGDGVGDDLGIDDINISGTVILRDTVHVDVTPLPTVNLGPDLTLCQGGSVDLDASVPGGSYLWQDGSTASTYHIATGGSYSVTVTAQNCSNSDQVDVAFNPIPVVGLGADTVLCAGSTLNLSAFGAGYAYVWQDGSTASTFTVNSPGLYWAEVTNNNCSSRDSILVGYRPMPSVFLGNDTAICAGATITLDATWPGATYLWQDGSSASTFQASASGNYQATVDLNGCTAQDAIQLSVVPLPQVDIGPDTTVCPGTSITFDATATGTGYLWNDGSTLAQFTTDLPGTYSVQVTANGCSAADTATLTNFSLQTVNLGADRSICAGSSTRLGTTVAGASYSWSTGESSDSITVNSAGTYWMEASLNGCTVRDSVNVSVTPLPVVSLGPDLQVCPGAQAILNAATAGATYLWSNGATTPAVSAGAGNWSVQVTVNGCSATDALVVTGSIPPVVDLGPDTLLCPGATLVLHAGPASNSYAWSTGASGTDITVFTASTVSVTATDALGCTATDAINIAYAAPGTVSLGADSTLCSGSQITLDASLPNASAYSWSTGATSSVLSIGNAGTYWVEVTVGACTVSDTVSISVAQSPVVSIGNDTTLCPGGSLILQAPATGDQLEWQNGTTGNSLTVSTAGDYWLRATNTAGCSDTAFIHVDYLDPGAMDLGPDTSICQGSSIQLNAGLPGGTTAWSGAVNASTPSVLATTAGTYVATTFDGGCSVTDSISIAITALPSVDLGPDSQFCAGSSLQLVASSTAALLWDNGTTNSARTVQQAGVYWVRASANGCSATDTVAISEVPLPNIDLGADTAVCADGHVTLDATTIGGSYVWNDGATTAVRSMGPGNWNVLVTASGCSANDSILIATIPSPVLDLPADTVLCNGASWLVDLAQPGCSYLWNTGSTSSSLLVSAAGSYEVTIDRSGCTTTGQVQVGQVDLSAFTLGPDTTLCPGQTIGLEVEIPDAEVLWSDGSTALHRTIATAGLYQATIAVDGCVNDASVNVFFTPLPTVDLGNDRVLCSGDTALLAVDPGNGELVWSTGSTDAELAITANGSYAAQLTLDGCTNADTVNISFLPQITELNLGPDQGICPGRQLLLDATMPSASYQWSTGSELPVLEVSQPGLYSVVVEGLCLHAVDSILISEGHCTPLVYVPNAFTPDGDGLNDLFAPLLDGDVRSWEFIVFNRWGERVFTSETVASGWDGSVGGKEAPMGVYVWSLHYTAVSDEGVVQEKRTGAVTLVR